MYALKGKKEPKANNKSELKKLEEKLQNVAETKKETGSLLNGYQNLEERLQTQEEVGEQK